MSQDHGILAQILKTIGSFRKWRTMKRTLRDLGKSAAFDPKQTSTSPVAGPAL
jgi:hypothetical protein